MDHKQVKVMMMGTEVSVDEGLVDLLSLIWSHGILTELSCQENRPGVAWISFPSHEDIKAFLDLVAIYPDENSDVPFWETMYGRITGCGAEDDWEYNCYLENFGVDDIYDDADNEVTHHFLGFNDFQFSIVVRFPVTDIPEIMEILKRKG